MLYCRNDSTRQAVEANVPESTNSIDDVVCEGDGQTDALAAYLKNLKTGSRQKRRRCISTTLERR